MLRLSSLSSSTASFDSTNSLTSLGAGWGWGGTLIEDIAEGMPDFNGLLILGLVILFAVGRFEALKKSKLGFSRGFPKSIIHLLFTS